jgi:hypothetical protein
MSRALAMFGPTDKPQQLALLSRELPEDNILSMEVTKSLTPWINAPLGGAEQDEEQVQDVKDASVMLTKYYMVNRNMTLPNAVRRATSMITESAAPPVDQKRFDGAEYFNPETGERAKYIGGVWHKLDKDGQWQPMKKK